MEGKRAKGSETFIISPVSICTDRVFSAWSGVGFSMCWSLLLVELAVL